MGRCGRVSYAKEKDHKKLWVPFKVLFTKNRVCLPPPVGIKIFLFLLDCYFYYISWQKPISWCRKKTKPKQQPLGLFCIYWKELMAIVERLHCGMK